jgi:hypothetical protein
MTTVTLNIFGFQVGSNDRVTLAYSLGWHEEFINLDKDGQASYRRQFMSGYLEGNLNVSKKESDRILSLTRDERDSEQQASVKRASAKFAYHISRTDGSSSKQVDEVAVLVRKYNALTKSQQKKFHASI